MAEDAPHIREADSRSVSASSAHGDGEQAAERMESSTTLGKVGLRGAPQGTGGTGSGWWSWGGLVLWSSGETQTQQPASNDHAEQERREEPPPEVPTQPPASPPTSSAPSELRNPVVASIEQNRSSWAAFFSSRNTALPHKAVEGRKEEEEVMEVDFAEHDDAPPPPKPVVVQPVNIPEETKKPTRSDTVRAGSSTKKTESLASAASTSRPSSIKEPVPVPSVQAVDAKPIPAAVKDEQSGSRSAPQSPTPSVKGKKNAKKPPVPRPPNLVLPGFSDTFSRPPRSHPPPQGMVKKALSFIVGDRKTTKLPGAMDPAEGLPKLNRIVGRPEPDVTRFGKIVVIGVHGCDLLSYNGFNVSG
jgi:hypothetical protein